MTDTSSLTPQPPQPDINTRIAQYVKLRNMKKEMVDRHKAEMAPLDVHMERIEALMLTELHRLGLKHAAGPDGTVYVSTKASATVADKSAFLDHVRSHDQWELMDYRANAPAVTEYIKENGGVAPPGVNYATVVTVGFRKS